MLWSEDHLLSELENAFQELKEKRGVHLANAIRPIVFTNHARGRIRNFLDDHDNSTPRDYVWRVADYYEAIYLQISQLQAGLRDAWAQLYPTIHRLAKRYLEKRGMRERSRTFNDADDCAQLVAKELMSAYYPYDTPFNAWLAVLVRNICFKYVKKEYNKPPTINQDLKEIETLLSQVSVKRTHESKQYQRLQEQLLEGIAQLSLARQRVILSYYFEERSFEEIAGRMERTVNAVYQLHFWALNDLREWFSKHTGDLE